MGLTLLAIIYIQIGITGCKDVDKVSDSLIFRYNEDQSVTTLDPAFVKSQSEIWITTQLFNGLLTLDSSLNPVQSLAKSWVVDEGGTVYKFTLRSDARFFCNQKGETPSKRPVKASDVVFSFGRILDPKVASPAAWVFNQKVINWDKADRWATMKKEERPFVAENDSVVVIRLLKPYAPFLQLLCTPWCSVVMPEAVKKHGDMFGRHPVGSGPFYLKVWEEEVKMVLRKNPAYFEFEGSQRLPYLEAVNIDFILNKQTAFMRFLAGEFDFFNGMEASFKDELLDKSGNLSAKLKGRINMQSMPFLNTEYLGFFLSDSAESNAGKVLQNVHLRKALNYAVDRKKLLKYLRNNVGIAGENGFVPPVLMKETTIGYAYNPAKAMEELSLAGYKNGEGLPELTLTATSDYLDLMVFIQKNWSDIGVKTRIEIEQAGMIRQKRNKGLLPIYRGSWIADYSDAENYLFCFYSQAFSPNGPNYTHFRNQEYDKIFEKLIESNDPSMQRKLQAESEKELIENPPFVILYYDKSLRLTQKNIKGLSNDGTNRLILKKVRKG